MNKIFDVLENLLVIIIIVSIFALGTYMNIRPILQLHKVDNRQIILQIGNERITTTINDIRDYVDDNGTVVLLEEINNEN